MLQLFRALMLLYIAEAFLKLCQLSDAELSLSNVPKFETYSASFSQTNYFGMLSEANPHFVRAQIEMSLGRTVARARAQGNDLFKSEIMLGLRLHPMNFVLYCNRAACWYKLGQWELSHDDCNQALNIQPNYTKALLRRAASNSKLERKGPLY